MSGHGDYDRDLVIAALDRAIDKVEIAARWRWALRALPFDSPAGLYRQAAELAVVADNEAREAINLIRLALGAEPLPHPAEPPKARPDE